ncbi:uncharacterized protein EV422DRAFT_131639 [Fimicolochytrium jonesii]|uniref:uncharacterized protein n=1 Tax=Fimicolochytrium jonesii TaxID=1396493 RepID=UPI0022FDC46A|nr:uncharacterized protein EV422DRAFT_131639 [Fimicolochytrium jonesii]KAI8825568.1 hypothetical protein EV422DRAFT_131639 [Fimicolochytrium jonesii]
MANPRQNHPHRAPHPRHTRRHSSPERITIYSPFLIPGKKSHDRSSPPSPTASNSSVSYDTQTPAPPSVSNPTSPAIPRITTKPPALSTYPPPPHSSSSLPTTPLSSRSAPHSANTLSRKSSMLRIDSDADKYGRRTTSLHPMSGGGNLNWCVSISYHCLRKT